MSFNADDSGDVIEPETIKMANAILSIKTARIQVMERLMKAVDELRVHPDIFLEQLRNSIVAEMPQASDWECKEGMRYSLVILDMLTEVRAVMKEKLTSFEVFDNEEDEKTYRVQQKEEQT